MVLPSSGEGKRQLAYLGVERQHYKDKCFCMSDRRPWYEHVEQSTEHSWLPLDSFGAAGALLPWRPGPGGLEEAASATTGSCPDSGWLPDLALAQSRVSCLDCACQAGI